VRNRRAHLALSHVVNNKPSYGKKMKRTFLLAISASMLLAGAATAQHRHHVYGQGAYHAYGFAPSAAPSNRCRRAYDRYRNEPPEVLIQDRDFQEGVLGVPFC
jgi:hypothetical protein